MNQINEKLIRQLKIEKDAFNLYNSFIKKIDDQKLKKSIIRIRDDEKEHIGIVEEMISLVKMHKAGIETVKEEAKKGIELKGFINEFSSLFITTNIDNYPFTIINIIKGLDMNCIYLSFNKMPGYIKKLLIDHRLDTGKIKFISCVKSSGSWAYTNPENLTSLSVKLEESARGMKGKFFVLIDSISAFSAYHSANAILRFVGLVNSKMEKYGSGIVWVAIDDEGEKGLNDKIGPLCDKIIKA